MNVTIRRRADVLGFRCLFVATLGLLGLACGINAASHSTEIVVEKKKSRTDNPHTSSVVKAGLLLGLDCASEHPASVALPLNSAESRLWEGEWLSTDSTLEDNVYEMLTVTRVDAEGFTYRFECRDVPYGPNARWIDEARASYRGPLCAEDEDNGRTFRLKVDPDDLHVRAIKTDPRWYEPVGCAVSDTRSANEFVRRRTIFNAGFDCELAATPVEVAICKNELLALGDLHMTKVYSMVRAASPAEDAKVLIASQRAWLRHRNSACVGENESVDEVCLARVYSDRLVVLTRLSDPASSSRAGFDAAYAITLLSRGANVGSDIAVRLAMYPLVVGTNSWRGDPTGILFESSHTDTRLVWPSDVEFRYSRMMFIGSDGTVWVARHIEPLADIEGLNRHQVWIEAGGDPFMIRSNGGFESDTLPSLSDEIPKLVRSWLVRHPITESMHYQR